MGFGVPKRCTFQFESKWDNLPLNGWKYRNSSQEVLKFFKLVNLSASNDKRGCDTFYYKYNSFILEIYTICSRKRCSEKL